MARFQVSNAFLDLVTQKLSSRYEPQVLSFGQASCRIHWLPIWLMLLYSHWRMLLHMPPLA